MKGYRMTQIAILVVETLSCSIKSCTGIDAVIKITYSLFVICYWPMRRTSRPASNSITPV